MTNVILDASVVSVVCSANKTKTVLAKFLEAARNSGVRFWLYTAEVMDLLSSMSSDADIVESRSHQAVTISERNLRNYLGNCQWLASLGQDMTHLEDPDPIAAALVEASRRLGSDTIVLTTKNSRIERGAPFVDVDTASIDQVSVPLEFVDLRTQQDRIRPVLETNLHRVLYHGRYVMGSEIEKLEKKLAQYVGSEYCVCVSSGTDALLISLLTLGIKPGDEVITSAFSFFSSASVIALLGAKPVYVDIDLETYTIDASQVESAVSDRTRAILPVSIYGQCPDMDAINDIAARHKLSVIEDAAQSFGATYKGRRSCTLTDLACTSFFPAKPLGAYGDAGACFTNDENLATVLRELRDHGQQHRYHHVRLGINGRMDTMQAAILLAKLEIFDDELEKRQLIALRYTDQLRGLQCAGQLFLPHVHPDNSSSWSQYTIKVKHRDALKRELEKRNVPTAVHYPTTLYDQPALLQADAHCPISKQAAKEVISLPMHPYLDLRGQTIVTTALSDALSAINKITA